MEIHALRLSVTDEDINAVIVRALPSGSPLRKVEVRLTAEGIHVKGTYTFVVGVPFETRWEVSIAQGKIAAHLTGVKVVGLGAGMLKGRLLGALVGAAAREDALRVEGETVLLDLDRLLAKKGVYSRTNLTAVRCGEGCLLIEASGSS